MSNANLVEKGLELFDYQPVQTAFAWNRNLLFSPERTKAEIRLKLLLPDAGLLSLSDPCVR